MNVKSKIRHELLKNNLTINALRWSSNNYHLQQQIENDIYEILSKIQYPEKLSISFEKKYNSKSFLVKITYDGSNFYISGFDEIVKRKSKKNPKTIKVNDILNKNDLVVIEDLKERIKTDFNILYRNAYKTAEKLLLKELSEKDYFDSFKEVIKIA